MSFSGKVEARVTSFRRKKKEPPSRRIAPRPLRLIDITPISSWLTVSKNSTEEPLRAPFPPAGSIAGQHNPRYHQSQPRKRKLTSRTSTLREVPDHQEIFLSPTTLSNFILELNQAVPDQEALAQPDQQQQQSTAPAGGVPATRETIDKAAATYHLHDLCDEGDTIQTVVAPQPVTLLKFVPDHLARAYKGAVSFTTPKTQRRHGASGGGSRIPAAVNGSAAATTEGVNGRTDAPQVSKLTCHYLMVRLEKQETDVLLFLNVPHDEFDAQGDARGLSREEEMATGLIETTIETLEVKDWGLFA